MSRSPDPARTRELRERIAAGEGTRTEFKSGLPRPRKVARTLAAFGNTRGGDLWVGVGDRGEHLGAPHPERTRAELERIAREEVEPSLRLSVTLEEVEGVVLVLARVGLSEARPHTVLRDDGTPEVPVRVGASTRSASGPALAALQAGAAAGTGGGRSGLSALEAQVLDWIGSHARPGLAEGGRTAQEFADACNVGAARARRAFVKLERAGRLVGTGTGRARKYVCP